MKSSKIAIAIASAALVVAVFAATPLGQAAGNLLPKNSVGSAQLKKSAVTGLKVRNGTLMAADFKAGQLPAGPRGAKGDPGIQGPKGDKGAPGATTIVKRNGVGSAAGPGSYSNASASCQAGETLVGGGATYNNNPSGVQATLIASSPKAGAQNAWSVVYRNDDGAGTVTAYAVALCATP
jgi:hypothetical protein